MTSLSLSSAKLIERVRQLATAREFIVDTGSELRCVAIGRRARAGLTTAAALVVAFSGYGVAQAANHAAVAAGLAAPAASEARLSRMEDKLAAMQAKVTTIRHTAQLHAARVEQRQALIAAALTGKGDTKQLALATLSIDPAAEKLAAPAIAPFAKIEDRQLAFAAEAQKAAETRLALADRSIRKLGLRPSRVIRPSHTVAMGGPLIAATSAEAMADLKADQQFRALFNTWKRLDGAQQGAIAIPSVQPVEKLAFTSNFGVRTDPFRGTAAMHAGVDIPGPTGTPIYATADGVVAHAERMGGYGNMIEVNHGKGIATRYGHLSKILVADNTRVKRGQLIGLMGSTGRSTGPHLHYEVRIDGHAVNPVPFLTTADYLLAAQDRAVHQIPVSSGPAPLD